MTLLEMSMIGVGGFIGAILRYGLSKKMNQERFPFGTLVVNLVGALLIGLVLGSELSRLWVLLLASGLAGALTTFSTLHKELIELWHQKKRKAISYGVITYGGGLFLAWMGYFIL